MFCKMMSRLAVRWLILFSGGSFGSCFSNYFSFCFSLAFRLAVYAAALTTGSVGVFAGSLFVSFLDLALFKTFVDRLADGVEDELD